MLRTLGLIGGLVLLSAAPQAALAAPPALERAFTSTVVTTYSDGRQQKLWMNRDGTYTSQGRRGGRYRGHWNVSGDRVCFRRSLGRFCTTLPNSGTAFTTRAANGETVQVRLAPGRQGEAAG
jgi:hypothetical protein